MQWRLLRLDERHRDKIWPSDRCAGSESALAWRCACLPCSLPYLAGQLEYLPARPDSISATFSSHNPLCVRLLSIASFYIINLLERRLSSRYRHSSGQDEHSSSRQDERQRLRWQGNALLKLATRYQGKRYRIQDRQKTSVRILKLDSSRRGRVWVPWVHVRGR